jgi:hypothetical protein
VVDHDVVLLIDFSTSTVLPTGRDIDSDGTVGEYREWIPRVRHILSDGLPTDPAPAANAQRMALQYADRARDAGVRLHAFAFGSKAAGGTCFEQAARRTGGEFLWIDDLSELSDQLPHLEPYALVPGLETVMIENLSTHASARAVRARSR